MPEVDSLHTPGVYSEGRMALLPNTRLPFENEKVVFVRKFPSPSWPETVIAWEELTNARAQRKPKHPRRAKHP